MPIADRIRVSAPNRSSASWSASPFSTVASMPGVIGGRAVHSLRGGRHAPIEVSAADDDRDLHSALAHLDDLPGDLLDPMKVETELLLAHQGLAGELQQDPVEDLRALAGFRGALFLNRHSARA